MAKLTPSSNARDLTKLATPAMRALSGAGITSLQQLTKKTEQEILQLHGMGPNALKTLKQALKSNGLAFRK